MPRSRKQRNFMITVFNYDLKSLLKKLSDTKKFKCYALQEEICPDTKKPHIQGYIEYNVPRTFQGVKRHLGDNTMHVEPRKGTKTQAVTYCTKQDTRKPDTLPHTYNIRQRGGRRPDLAKCITDYLHGTMKADAFRAKYPQYWIQCKTKLNEDKDEIDDTTYMSKLALQFDKAMLRPWQTEAINLYLAQDDRTILWIYDKTGNTGKSWLTKYIYVKFKNVYLCENGKASDIVYAYKKQPYVCYDLSRSQERIINYMTMEGFKNGKLFSGKYHSKMIIFTPAKVIVFANYMPDTSSLSLDRWAIYKISSDLSKLILQQAVTFGSYAQNLDHKLPLLGSTAPIISKPSDKSTSDQMLYPKYKDTISPKYFMTK